MEGRRDGGGGKADGGEERRKGRRDGGGREMEGEERWRGKRDGEMVSNGRWGEERWRGRRDGGGGKRDGAEREMESGGKGEEEDRGGTRAHKARTKGYSSMSSVQCGRRRASMSLMRTNSPSWM